MSFQQGLSGLNAASKSLEAIGNNVANASTVGFKESQAQFADVYAASLTGAGTSQIGIGTKVAQIQQQFTQGNISATNNPLDVAINGGGFFRMSSGGTISYARNGQFQLDKTGYIVNANGARLTGYSADATGTLSTGAPTEININSAPLPPKMTATIDALVNLKSSSDLKTWDGTMDPKTFNNASSVTVFDSLGNSHVIQTFYVKTGASSWDVYGASDGALLATPLIGTLNFGSDGAIDTGTTTLPFTTSVAFTNNSTSPMPLTINFNGSTQYGSDFTVSSLKQDGYESGRLAGFNVGPDGTITGRYTNGKSSTLGQVVLANFTNPNGLSPLGNNLWAETSTSGPALVQGAGNGNVGVLQSSAVEDSNVDLTAELVNMITAQRVYQANAQTIKTQDQVMQTLVNLR